VSRRVPRLAVDFKVNFIPSQECKRTTKLCSTTNLLFSQQNVRPRRKTSQRRVFFFFFFFFFFAERLQTGPGNIVHSAIQNSKHVLLAQTENFKQISRKQHKSRLTCVCGRRRDAVSTKHSQNSCVATGSLCVKNGLATAIFVTQCDCGQRRRRTISQCPTVLFYIDSRLFWLKLLLSCLVLSCLVFAFFFFP
jgi:hypothetical protein